MTAPEACVSFVQVAAGEVRYEVCHWDEVTKGWFPIDYVDFGTDDPSKVVDALTAYAMEHGWSGWQWDVRTSHGVPRAWGRFDGEVE